MHEISILKKQMASEKDLGKIVRYFFDLMDQDKIAFDPRNCPLENLDEHPELNQVVQVLLKTVSDFMKKPFKILKSIFCEIKHEKFYHGSCILQGHSVPVLFFYAADNKISIVVFSTPTGKTDYFRFSLVHCEEKRSIH